MAGTKRLFRVGPLTRRASLLVYIPLATTPRFILALPPHRPFIPSAGLAREIADRNLSNFPNGPFLRREIERSIKRGTRRISVRKWKLGCSFVSRRSIYLRVVHLPRPIQFSSSRRNCIVSIDYSQRKIRLRHSTIFSLAKNTFLEKYLISI